MIIVNGEAVGSGVPKGAPAPAEGETVPVSPSVARSVRKARQTREPESTKQESKAPKPKSQPEPEPAVEESEAPKDYAPKGDWVDYAVSVGADRDDAESLTKSELIDLYGGD